MESPPFSLLSYGGGQDSVAILHLYFNDREFRKKYAPNRLLVVLGATLNEHPETDEHVKTIKELCAKRGVEFIHVTPDYGFHSGAWSGGLLAQWSAHNTIGSAAYPKSCTVALKTAPVWSAVEMVIERDFGFPAKSNKRGLRAYAEKYGKIPCIIGIAKGEESRMAQKAVDPMMLPFDKKDGVKGPKKDPTPKWMLECVERIYPLVDIGFDRAAAQRYIASVGEVVPPPSNCMACPYKSREEVLWTQRKYPEFFAKWVALEAAKLKHWAGKVDDAGKPVPNYGVKGKQTLVEFHKEAVERHGHMTMQELDTYIFSHGHCVASKH